MFYLSMTRLRLKSPLYLIPFFIQHEKILNQLRASQGFIKGKVLAAPNLSMWTVTIWKSEHDLRAFYLSGEHRETMKKISKWSLEAVTANQSTELDTIPSWENIRLQLIKNGRFIEITNPSFEQTNRTIPRLSSFCLQKSLFPICKQKKYTFIPDT